MATNILALNKFGPTQGFNANQNSDWLDSLAFVTTPGGSTPIDITGITFKGMLRSEPGDPQVYLSWGTSDGTMLNGGGSGILGFNVPQSKMKLVFTGTYFIDVVAEADGHVVNLFPTGPGTVVINPGVTTP